METQYGILPEAAEKHEAVSGRIAYPARKAQGGEKSQTQSQSAAAQGRTGSRRERERRRVSAHSKILYAIRLGTVLYKGKAPSPL